MMRTPAWKRLSAALAASLLLHAALLFMHYLGTSADTLPPAVQGGRNRSTLVRVLDARLIPEEKPAFAAGAPSPVLAQGRSTGGASPARRSGDEPGPALNRGLGMGLLPLPAPAYYTTDQLTQRPRPRSEPELDTPALGPMIAAGAIILKLWISEQGEVIAVEVEKSELPGNYAETAVAAFRKLRFTPGELDGRRVGTLMRIEVTYGGGRGPSP
jgi:hypothetical protein